MIFDIPYLIEYLSSFMTLQPGDMIATGTPEGLADVVPGDEVVVEVEGVGRLVNRIVSEAEFFARKTRRGMSMIKHWINGREVESRDTFINYNPATGEAIGEVASGGAEEVAGRGGGQGSLPEMGQHPGQGTRRLMRKLGELIDQNVPNWPSWKPSTPACRSTRPATC
jgi:hypothetical protein